MKKLLLLLALFGAVYASDETPLPSSPQQSDGQIINPITDICWSCAFPIRFPGSGDSKTPITCSCLKEGTLAGFPIAFWEPSAILEVTRTPYKFVSLNLDCSPKSCRDRGGVRSSGSSSGSFFQVHYIPCPFFRVLALVPGFECMREWKELVPPWCSEWDPSWKYPELAKIFTDPEFDHSLGMINQCSKDCEEAKSGKQTDKYWWCAGCLGSFYPLSGHVAHHVSTPKSSALLAYRMLGKIHTIRWWAGGPNGYKEEEGGWCGQDSLRRLPKRFYKIQMLRPISIKSCQPLGAPPKEMTFPDGGEDFAYLVWTEKRCCFNPSSAFGQLHLLVSGTDIIDGIYKKIQSKMEALPSFLRVLIDPLKAKSFIGKTEAILGKVKQFSDRVEMPELGEMTAEGAPEL